MNNFWTDELVKEFCEMWHSGRHFNEVKNELIPKAIKQFKASKEQDWEVVEFRKGRYSFKRCSDGRFRCDEFKSLEDNWGQDDLLHHETKFYPIHSVRIKSDITYTVGDKVLYIGVRNYPHFVVDNFFVKDGKVLARNKTMDICEFINDLKHATPLFTTHDGKEVYEGDEYWRIISDSTPQMETAVEFGREQYKIQDIKRFSTREAAEEYVLHNKRNLSLNDILPIIRSISDNARGKDNKSFLYQELKQLAKTRL